MPDADKNQPKGSRKKPKKRKGRRARGTGAIFFSEKRQRWIGRKPIGKKLDGKTQYREVWGETQEEVVERLKGLGPSGEDTTVAEWGRLWLGNQTVRPSTKEGYTRSVNDYIIPAFGGVKLKDVAASQVTALLKKLIDSERSAGTVGNIQAHGRAMFEAAKDDRLCSTNPFAIAKRPKVEKKEMKPFSPADLRRIIAGAADLSAGHLIALLAGTGCRLGEASALDVADFDPVRGTIKITKTYSKRFGIGPPKSKHSSRTITVPAPVRPSLIAAAGDRVEGPLFRTAKGKRFIKTMVSRAFGRVLSRLKLEARNVHQLRHSVATALVAAGTPIGDTAKYLGDSVATVVKTYLHPSGADPAIDLDRILAPVALTGPGRGRA